MARNPLRRGGKSSPRRVRTPGGARLFGQPIGTIITRDMLERAQRLAERGANVALDAREASALKANRGPRPVKGVKRADVYRVAGRTKSGKRRAVRPNLGSMPDRPDVPGNVDLPEGHRYHADPIKERAARYIEAVDDAKGEDDLETILDQLDGDGEFSDRQKSFVTNKLLERAVEMDLLPKSIADQFMSDLQGDDDGGPDPKVPDAPEAPQKPAPDAPATPDVPEAKPDVSEAKPEAAQPKRKPSVKHKNVLARAAKSAATVEGVEMLQGRADAWRKEGLLSEKMHADISAVIEARRTEVKAANAPSPEEVAERRKEVQEVLADPGVDLKQLWSLRHNVGLDAKHGIYTPEERDRLISTIDARRKRDFPGSPDVDPNKVRYTPGNLAIEGDDTGALSPKDRNFVINPKDTDDSKHQAHIRELEANPDSTPAGKALAAGAKIKEVEDPDGLEQYIRAHPERFEVVEVGGGNTGAATFSVRDKQHGEVHFFKRGSNDGPVGSTGDSINEVLAGKLGAAAFPDLFLDADFAERPEFGGNPLIRMDHIDERAAVHGSDTIFYDSGARDLSAPMADRKQPLALQLFNYFSNNNDRHDGNIGWFLDSDGKMHIVPTDNGNAFNAYNAYAGENSFDIDDVLKPEEMSYARFMELHLFNEDDPEQNKEVSSIADILFEYAKGDSFDKAALTRDVRQIVETFRKVDIDSIIADLKRRFPNMDDYEAKHMEAAAAIWKNRVTMFDEVEFFEALAKYDASLSA